MFTKIFKLFLQRLRNFVLGDFRSKRLSDLIVKKILKYNKKKKIRILDYGSGYQPQVVFFVYQDLVKKYRKKIEFDCFDFYSKNDLIKLNKKKNKNIKFRHINSIKGKKKRYDFCLVNDVIHHIGIEKEDLIKKILNDLLKISNIVFIKDHFQKGIVSNNIIRFMDFLGNYFNDVNTPSKYYDKKTFKRLLSKMKITVLEKKLSVKLYPSFLLFMSNPDFNFVYLIKKD
jgi:hypothetical protein